MDHQIPPTLEEAINQSNQLVSYVDHDKIIIERYEPTLTDGMEINEITEKYNKLRRYVKEQEERQVEINRHNDEEIKKLYELIKVYKIMEL